MRLLLALHGDMRWIVSLLAVGLIIKNTIGLVQKRPYTILDRQLMIGYAAALVLNFALGLVLLFSLPGGFLTSRIEHAVTMVLAILVASSASRWAKLDEYAVIYRNNLIVVGISLVLIFVGVMRLRGGWIW
ncbi:MAG: hypothetical protein AAF490_19075 [Chloroflexota bacterium]